MSRNEYVIPFVGLKLGTHEFEFDITDEFFEVFEYSIVESGEVKVLLQLEKKETMLIGNFQLSGFVRTSCDRCNDPLKLEIEGEYQLVFKFDDKPSDDETLVIIYPDEFEIDLNSHILELISVSLPSKKVHDEGECNEEMIELLEEYTSGIPEEELEDEEDAVDPRWEALKKLKK
jgi:uncharacterized metal-binding protein YceD (DUF177 family)